MSRFTKYLNTALTISILFASVQKMSATTITWGGATDSENMANTANWTPAQVPAAGDIATFDSSTTYVAPALNSPDTISTDLFYFPSAATPESYTFGINGGTLTFTGTTVIPGGVQISSGISQIFNIYADGVLTFQQNTSADVNNTGLPTYNAGQTSPVSSGDIIFMSSSSLGAATVTAVEGSEVLFEDTSTGGPGSITLNTGSAFFTDHNVTIGALSVVDTSSVVDTQGILTIGNSGNQTINGIITDVGSLNKAGSGTLTLTNGGNNYTGGTTVSQGTLLLNNVIIPGNVAISSGANLDFEEFSGSETYSGTITGAGNVLVNQLAGNTGTVILTGLGGTNNYTGSTNINAGTLEFNNSTTMTLSSAITINTGASADFEQANLTAGTYSGAITGGGNVLVNQSGSTGIVLFTGLSGTSNYTGLTQVGGGTLEINNSTSSTLSSAISIVSGATVDFEQAAGSTGTYGGAITGAGNVLVNQTAGNSGAVVFSNPGTVYTGMTTVSNGLLEFLNMSFAGAITNNATVDFDTATSATYSGIMTGSGSVTINNNASPVNMGTVVFTQNNTYRGTTTVANGTLQQNNVLIPGNAIVNTGAILDFEKTTGTEIYSGTITGAGGVSVNQQSGNSGTVVLTGITGTNNYSGLTSINNGTLIFQVSGASTTVSGPIAISTGANVDFEQAAGTQSTYSGAITGAGNVLVNQTPGDTGTVILSGIAGISNYTGTTTVGAGTLEFNSSSATPTTLSSPLSISSGATIDFEQASGTTSTYSGTITGSGNVIVNQNVGSTGEVIFSGIAGTSNYTGSTTVNGGTLEYDITSNAPTTLTGPISLSASSTLDIEKVTSSSATFSGAITGSGNVLINQTAGNVGNVIFSNAGTNYSGTTTVSGGSLELVNLSLSGSIVDNATVDLESTTSTSYTGLISGTGNLTINNDPSLLNSGTVIISGSNTYTGSTTITRGTLQVNSAGSLIATTSPFNINANATLDLEQSSGTGTYNGLIAGAGNLAINSVLGNIGTVVLNNSNSTYTGSTTVAGGTLQINSTGTTISSSSNIVLNAGSFLDLEQVSGIGTYSNPITGGGNLTVNTLATSTGTVTLGAAQYTGTTLVSGGTLDFVTTVPSTSLITLAAKANVDFSLTGNFAGNIAGMGNVIVSPPGAGTFILSGLSTSTYTGTTSVTSGTLIIDNSSPTATLLTNITLSSGTTLDLDQAAGTTGTYQGNITGSGAVGINALAGDTGTVVLAGTNSYTGGTTVMQGTLQGNTTSLQGSIVDNATLTFNQSAKGTFVGTLSGPSSALLNITGPGKVHFNTNNSAFTGTTMIYNGHLALDSLLGGNVIVQNFGLLSGIGTILGNAMVNAGGFISPGNSIGTLNVNGNYTQNGTYVVQVQGDQSSLINVGGAANLGPDSSVFVVPISPFNLIEEPYTILTAAGGVNGAFSSVTSSSPIYAPFVTYDATHAYLTLQVEFALITATYNQRQVADQLSTITNPTPEQEAILEELVFLPTFEAQKALDEMSAQQYTNLILSAELANRQFIRRLYDPLRAAIASKPCAIKAVVCDPSGGNPPHAPIDFWLEVSGGKSFFQGSRNARGYRLSGYEFTFGAQTVIDESWLLNTCFEGCLPEGRFLLGTAGSYEEDHTSYRVGGSGKSNIGMGALYGLFRAPFSYILGDLVVGQTSQTMNRPVDIGRLHYKSRSKPRVTQATFYIEAGHDYVLNAMLVQPFIGLEYGYYHFNRISERGCGPLNVTVSSKSRCLGYSRLGLHFTAKPLRSRLAMGLDLAWQYRLNSEGNVIYPEFDDFGSRFTIKGLHLNRNSFDAAVRLMQPIGQWEFFVEANCQSWQNAFNYSFIGGVKATW